MGLADGVEEGPTLGEDVDTATTAVHQVELVPAHTTYHTHTFEQRNLGPAPRAMDPEPHSFSLPNPDAGGKIFK